LLGGVFEGVAFGGVIDEEVEGIVNLELSYEINLEGEVVCFFRKSDAGEEVSEGVLLPI